MNTRNLVKDYEGFRDLMISRIPVICPEWTDTSQTDFGIVMIELLATALDVLSYYQDKSYNENLIPTAQQRSSMIKLAKAVNYKLAGQTPSSFVYRITKDEDYLGSEILIPKDYKLSTEGEGIAVMFETATDLVIPAGSPTGDVVIVHGVTTSDVFNIPVDSPSLKLKLTYPDVLEDTARLVLRYQGIDITWDKVEDFLDSSPTDYHFVISTDELNYSYIEFGNNVSGAMVKADTTVTATYRVGGGVIGNVGNNTVTKFVDATIEGIASGANITLIEKGTNVEDIEVARMRIPRHQSSRGRAVTPDDYEYFAELCPVSSKVKAVETFNANNEIDIYFLNTSYVAPSVGEKAEMKDFIDKVKMSNIAIVPKDMSVTDVTISVDITVLSTYVRDTVRSLVIEALEAKFLIENMSVEQNISMGEIFATVLQVKGLDPSTLLINLPLSAVTAPANGILNVNSIIVNATGGIV